MSALPGPQEWDFLEPAQRNDALGRLGPYCLLDVLGAGGMGVVFRAEDTHLQRLVALKVLRPSLAASAAARERFLCEARAAAAVEHDHIVSIWQVGEHGGIPFLAMPLLRGESLDRRLDREGRLPVAEVLRIGRETARGLAAAHAQGLVHCDIKPANLWLEEVGVPPSGGLHSPPEGGTPTGRVKILDFGLARAAGDAMDWTCEDAGGGTPCWMAPEQSRGGSMDGRADLFSLGCVLYRMATGQLPFQGTDSMATLIAAAVDQPKLPTEIRPELDPALSDLVMRLLAKDPAQRPPSAEATAQALEAIEGGIRHPQMVAGAAAWHPLPARRHWPSRLVAAAVLLLVPGPVGPALPDSVPESIKLIRQVAGRAVIAPTPWTEKRPRGEETDAVAKVEEQRNAVGCDIRCTQADLEVLESRLEKRKAPVAAASLSAAVDADEEVRDLRSRIAKARGVLDEYRSRGCDPGRPTPRAAARAVADLQARLDQRVKEIEEGVQSPADDREPLRQARLELVARLEALRKVYDGLEADLDKLKHRKAKADHLLPDNPQQPLARIPGTPPKQR
jgi:hypothetical protein